MDTALDALRTAGAGIRDVDAAVADTCHLQAGVVALQEMISHIAVTQARWVHELAQRQAFAHTPHRDPAAWLAATAKTSRGLARRQVELGRAMDESPVLDDAVSSGAVSPEAAHMLLPALTSDHSGDAADVAHLLSACAGATPAEAKAAGAKFRELHPPGGTTPKGREHALRERRALRFSDNGDGTTDVHGTLTTVDAAVVQKALRSLIGKPTVGDDRSAEQKTADALLQLCDAYGRGEVRGGRGNAPVILVTIDAHSLASNTGFGVTSTGQIISAEAVRRLTSNAHLQRVLLADSVVLDEGRRVRLATDDQWRALVARDGGCRFGCDLPPEWCQVDHIQEWDADAGPTDIDLLYLACCFHHHFRHRPDVELIGDANDLRCKLPDGRMIPLPARSPTSIRGAA